jgi:hypothetical protein
MSVGDLMCYHISSEVYCGCTSMYVSDFYVFNGLASCGVQVVCILSNIPLHLFSGCLFSGASAAPYLSIG